MVRYAPIGKDKVGAIHRLVGMLGGDLLIQVHT
jgi:hypothetical protein